MTRDRAAAVERLSTDVFGNLMTLKMLDLYPEACATLLYTGDAGWACLTLMDLAASAWDRRTYPEYPTVAILDGNAPALVEHAFRSAPAGPCLFKVHDQHAASLVRSLPGARHARTYHSYTTPPGLAPPPLRPEVVCSAALTDEAVRGLAQNGYGAEELQVHFQRGARWFALRDAGRMTSLCFVFQNYGRVWEIGGVYTPPELRRMGYARAVVEAALRHLLEGGLTPRYQLRSDNTASRAVAESLGLVLRLTVDHYTR